MSRFGVRGLAVSIAAAVTVGLLPAVSVAANNEGPALPGLKQPKAVPVTKAPAGGAKKADAAAANAWKRPKVVWPAAGSADVDLTEAATTKSAGMSLASKAASAGGKQRAGSLPVSVAATGTDGAMAAPAKVKVAVADRGASQKAGVDGLLLSLSRTDRVTQPGSAQVEVDYSAFKGAYGGDWAARLHLVELPACALTTPEVAKCRMGKPLSTTNNTKTGTLAANVPLAAAQPLMARASTGATVLAATADASGGTGDYKATSLQSSGSWSAGGSMGAFNWSYPLNVPSVPGDLQPKMSLGYSSQSVDGRTAASNNQSSWLGDGWSMEPGFIERRYKSCNDDKTGGTNTTKVGDLCWFNDNATMSLNGKSTELVYDATAGWHPAADSGEKIEKLTGANNGDNDGEHWKVTDSDGTQYYFGLNRLPGWKDATTPTTNSTWTVPVFGNQSGEPCYNASFASAWCQQAWRWQLDYVVDVRGNAMAYYWNTESNNYGRNVSVTTGKATVTSYVRGGWLDHIDYGLRSDTVYSAKAMGQVKFDVSERCLTTCGTFDTTNATNWPDVPFDLYCKDGATECKNQYSPTFWSRKRLTTITTKALTGGAYKDVDSWALQQGFPAAGDGVSTPMWLQSITRTGKSSGTVALPPVMFAGVQKPNRVDKLGDGLAPFIRLRMSQITTESGGTIGIDYLDPECTATTLPPADGTNTTRCYPVKWAYEGDTAKQDWFNSYVVQRVTEGDNLANTPDTVTEYSYLSGAKWAKSTDEFTKPEDRGYSIARGYERVQTRKGTGTDPKTLSESRYFRGIDGAQVKDSDDADGTAVTDREQFAGRARSSSTFNGDGGALISRTSYTPWRSAKTATRTRAGLPDLEAYQTGTEKESTRTTITGGARTTELTRHFDSYGMVDSVSQSGDTDKTGDEQCTITVYVRNTNIWVLNKVAETRTTAGACGTASSALNDGVIDDTRTYFDNNTDLNAAPAKGNATKTEKIKGDGSGYDTVTSVPSTCGPLKNQLCYDQYGRVLATADPYGKITTTAYTPATGESPTKTVVTNPLAHAVTTMVDPLRGQPTQVTDANGKITTTAYDGLGRIAKVWIPTRSAVTYPNSPNYAFTYQVHNDAPTVVASITLTHDNQLDASYTFYDGLLRARETQSESPDRSGRLISETFYNTRGEANRTSGTYYTSGKAEPVLVTGAESTDYPASTETQFDGAGRTTAVLSKRFGDVKERTATSYTGDSTTVIPPQGGTSSTAVADALGRTTELRQYTDADRTTYQSTLYSYNKLGRLEQVTDPSGAKWTYTYDTRGRQTRVDDADKGASTTAYDQGDRVTDTTDARGITLHTDYDALGRKTALKNGTSTLAAWTYDTVAKGKPGKSTRYVGSDVYTTEITGYDDLYNPNDTVVTIPASEGKLANTYEWFAGYNANSGQQEYIYQPAIGDLPEEQVSTTYTAVHGLVNFVNAGSDPLISATTYDHYGKPTRREYGAFNQHVWSTTEYDDHTGQPTRVTNDRDTNPKRIDDTHYTYDPAGNLTSIAAAYGQDTTRTTDTQCFTTDALRRITEAWTNTGEQCATTPSDPVIGGQDPYWTSYTYDPVGNRKTEIQHKTPSGPTADTTRTYTAPDLGTHNLPKVTQTGTGAHDETYTYDQDGNTKTRAIGPSTQTLTWDDEGHLKTLTDGTNTSNYLYDTDGQRLIRRDSTGTTLYLPGGNELHVDKVGLVTGTRYYSAAGQTVAMRTGSKLTYLLSDSHGTGTTQITADATQTITRRKSTIFGAPRGDQPTTWTGDKGFVGGTKDTDTGLTHLGAREYDPATGRFISVDPIMDLKDPQQAHGYTYGSNNPLVYTDPTGQMQMCGEGGAACYEDDWNTDGTKNTDDDRETSGSTECRHDPDCIRGTIGGTGSGSGSGSGSGKHKGKGVGGVTYKGGAPYINGVCVWAAGSTCGHGVGDEPAAAVSDESLDWVCVPSESSSRCSLRKSLYRSQAMMEGFAAVFGAKAAGGRGESGNCFLAGTEVLMSDKSTKKIEDIKVGDEVTATDPQTGKTSKRQVSALIVTEGDKHLNELTITTKDGPKKVTATREHPFWVPSEHRWVRAGDLKSGMTLLRDDGSAVPVQANRAFLKHTRTYNLTITDDHTYYVLAGATPVLVHNDCGDSFPIYRSPKTADKNFELEHGPNPDMQHAQGSNGFIYFGEKSVAMEYQGRGPYASGLIRYDMHPSFLSVFEKAPQRYDWQGPGGSPRIEFEVPFGRLHEFNSLTQNRTWLPHGEE
ncbi:polymorphic toxin-type HINT domain-containing protein [Streptomyces sp. SDr-06]|uniref:polymorphic toxin-type HINT domain-containing protein n=1 Tax=Streptomyces sp. SDr-06 TaxID=2267702 RepID=UPI001CB8FA05|nr:polymorphic toxin-type HINT domain-containing protein [Streptomyces sp. SDr-06]